MSMKKQIVSLGRFLVYKDKTFLAVIPARGESKRLPRKNILDLYGKPLIAWSIEAGLHSKYIDDVIVSSDDNEILDIAKKYNASTIKRPDYLASDTATTFDTLRHVLDNVQSYDYIILLQPTSPLRTYNDVDTAIEFLFNKEADAVVSLCEMEHSPLWSNILPDDKNMQHFLSKEVINKRGQDLEIYYRLNGAIYICKIDVFLKQKSFFIKENIFAYEMSQKSSIDVDTQLDFDIANYLLLSKHKII